MNNKIRQIVFVISALCLLTAVILFFSKWIAIPYLFAVGASGIAITRLTRRYEGKNQRLKRLYFIETIAALLLVVASYFMFRNQSEWFMLVTIAAFLQLYTSFIIPKEEKKEEQK